VFGSRTIGPLPGTAQLSDISTIGDISSRTMLAPCLSKWPTTTGRSFCWLATDVALATYVERERSDAHTITSRFEPDVSSVRSRRLTEEFVRRWEALHPGGKLIARDLTKTELAPVTAEWVRAAYTPEESRSTEQRQLLAVSDGLIAELEAADEYVIGVPMHNFSIPSTVKLWIDLIARPGKTFAYVDAQPKGLLQARRRRFLSHRVESTIQEQRWHRSTS
jgi:NAD(P)H-dependent FMN reductase